MAYVGALGLWDIARPHLEALVARTGESSSMAQLDGSDIVYVARVSVPKIIALRVEIGTRFPAVQTSQGKVLLAALSPDELDATLAEPSRAGLPPYIGRSRRAAARRADRGPGPRLGAGRRGAGARVSARSPSRCGTATGTVRAAMNVTVHAAETSHRAAAAASTSRCCCAPPATSAPSGRCGSPGRTWSCGRPADGGSATA